MNFFNYLKNKRDHSKKGETENMEQQQNLSEVASNPETLKPKNEAPVDYIDMQQNLTDGIVLTVRDMLTSSSFSPDSYVLSLYINDVLLFHSCKDGAYARGLAEKLDMEYSCRFKSIEIKEGMPPVDLSRRPVFNNVFICIMAENKPAASCKARIKVISGNGSLIDPEIILDSQTMNELPEGRMNIGVGKTPKLDNGIVRINHIAVDDNPNIPEFAMNKYVSRAHAYIKYSPKNGFILYVEAGGTPERGKRTMVNRGGVENRLDVAGTGISLQNGDQIVLSRSVILYFENIKE